MNQKPSPLHRASEWIVDHYRLFFVVFAALLVFSAVASGWVKVENDVAAYLPADSETRQGLDIMEQEFQTYGSAKILLRDTDADAAAATAEQIRAVDGVDSCTYTMNDTGSALLSVSLSDLEGSDTCAQTVQALRDLLDGSGAYIYSAEGYSISDQINGEVRGLLVTFLAAALINKGTNFVFGTISFVSNAVAILLQLFEFLNDKIADGTVTLSAAQAAQVTALSSPLERAGAQLEGTSYHRLVLTLVIQGSIWINFGITVLTGEYVLFMVYLVASAIQMGCNVDYAIVVASHYTEARADQGPREAMITALNLAFPTIITSGTMLISVGLLIGARVSSGTVAGMGRQALAAILSVGCLIAMLAAGLTLRQRAQRAQ